MLILALALQLFGSFTKHEFVSDAGTRAYWLYVPSSYNAEKPAALIVMLHGCTQDARDIARGSRLNEHAEQQGFIVLYPEQAPAANLMKCWNWFDAKHQERGAGEPAIIAGMVEQVAGMHRIDAARVFLAGISAGAAMANLLAVSYPELFAAIALHAGIEYKAAKHVVNARAAMGNGGPDPVTQGNLAYAAMGERARFMPLFIVSGKKDTAVPPLHAEQIAKQWLTTFERLGLEAARTVVSVNDAVAPAHSYSVEQIYAQDGRLMVQTTMIEQMGHALSGGSAEGTFTDPNGPDSIAEMLRFFHAAVK